MIFSFFLFFSVIATLKAHLTNNEIPASLIYGVLILLDTFQCWTQHPAHIRYVLSALACCDRLHTLITIRAEQLKQEIQ